MTAAAAAEGKACMLYHNGDTVGQNPEFCSKTSEKKKKSSSRAAHYFHDKLAEETSVIGWFSANFSTFKGGFWIEISNCWIFFQIENSPGFASTKVWISCLLSSFANTSFKCFTFTNPVQDSVKIQEKMENSNPLCKVSKIFVSEKTIQYLAQSARYCRRHHHAGSRSRPFLAVAAQCWHSSFKDDRFGTWHFPCLKIK